MPQRNARIRERRGRRWIAGALALTLGAALLHAGPAPAGTRAINFDDATTAPCTFSETSPLTNRYTASMGVTFAGPAPGQGGAILDQCGGFGVTGHSPPKFLAFNLTAGYPQPPETITFVNPIHSFEIKAGQNGSGGTFTITGFDGTTPVSVNSRNSTQTLSVLTLAATRMTSVKLEYVPGTVPYMIFDDMKFGTAPISGDESFEVTQGQTLDVPAGGVLSNDSDPDGDALTPSVTRPPGNGTVDLRSDGSFTYTPNPEFFGTDSFGYRAGDGTGTGNEATVSIRVNQLPPPPPPPPPPPVIVTPPPPPPPPPGPGLRTPVVLVSYKLLRDPTRTTNFLRLSVKNVPRGSAVVGRCLTKKGKKCKGKLGKKFTKKGARGAMRVKAFERKNFPAGSKLEFVITNPGFVTQIKTVTMIKNNDPAISTRCQRPGTSRRGVCGRV